MLFEIKESLKEEDKEEFNNVLKNATIISYAIYNVFFIICYIGN